MERRIGKSDGGLLMTPMIDIVFQLIAFFIFATSYSTETVSSQVRPPETSLEGAQVGQDTVLVEIDQQARILADDGPVPISEPLALELLETRFRDAGPETVCVVRADRDVPYAMIDKVLEFCRGKKLRSVVLRLQIQES